MSMSVKKGKFSAKNPNKNEATIIHTTANLEDGEDFLDHTVSYAHKNLPLGGGTNTALCVTPINLDQPGCSKLRTS